MIPARQRLVFFILDTATAAIIFACIYVAFVAFA
jgi:hypothetical protein